MIKINIPIHPAKIHLKYTGRRLNLNETYTTFSNVGIEFEKTFKGSKEPISVKIKLFDETEFYLGLISRKIYFFKDSEWMHYENGYLIHHEIVLSNNLTFINSLLTFDTEFNGEFINETYLFKLIINSGNKINQIIIDSEIEYENFTT